MSAGLHMPDFIYLLFWGSKGFDRVLEVGEASRRMMRQISQLKLNAEDNLAYAA